jgi:3-oxoacyl-[acyl-carrier protein] reductase
MNMKDKVAIVTGGSKGIGLAVARVFAQSGVTVAIVVRGADASQAARVSLESNGLKIRSRLRRLQGF